ncbi:hypothetical protein [Schlesneria paludicola]|uniref:hypothetical protein n=1 Tax=Schlesneria paludicola TaxID=360056 RepID=UPI00029B19AA|nr:hypothetical protein [Schlesneria paludicola]
MLKFSNRSLRWFACVAVVVAVAAVVELSGSRPQPVAAEESSLDLQAFMRKKLGASSQILEGLTVEDPGLIRQGAATLLEMSKVEKWNVLTDADYRDFNRDFRTAVRKLDEAAAKSNLDNAMLQWMDAMKGCVECHKYVRSQRPVLKK